MVRGEVGLGRFSALDARSQRDRSPGCEQARPCLDLVPGREHICLKLPTRDSRTPS